MPVSTMEKLTVFALKRDTDAIVRRLIKLRAVSDHHGEFDGMESFGVGRYDGAAVNETAARLSRIEAVIPVLAKRSRRKKGLFSDAVSLSFADFCKDGRRARAEETVAETEKALDRIAALKASIAEAEADKQALLPYLELIYPLDFFGTDTTVHIIGSLPVGTTAERLEEAVSGLGFDADILGEDAAGVYISALCYRGDQEAVQTALSGLGFLKASFRTIDGTPKELLARAEAEAAQLHLELEKCEESLVRLAENLTDVEILSDLERTTLISEEQKARLSATGECTLFSMWCPTATKEKVSAVLDQFSAAYEFEKPDEKDDVPVLLQNNSFAKNFEWVLGMYSYPRYGAFDPTLIMSIFYFVIFGLMFADAGYGLLLTVACFGIVRWCQPRESMKRFLLMFGWCGISCIVFGVLFGSYFGNFPLAFMENVLKIPVDRLPNLSLLPTTAANMALLFDPLQNPMAFLVVSLAAGGVHLIAGMAVKAVLLCREGKALDALFDIVTYWILFLGIGLIFVNKTAGLVVSLIGAVSIVATQGRAAKGVMKFFGGLLGLYDLVSYASDLLSYSRILALGLAAGVIGQVVNILATLKGASVVGFIMLVLVFAVGHVLNLVINVLGTFVHTSRLQYIEFFGKFYEDGGTPFKPLSPSDKYARDIAPEEELTH